MIYNHVKDEVKFSLKQNFKRRLLKNLVALVGLSSLSISFWPDVLGTTFQYARGKGSVRCTAKALTSLASQRRVSLCS